MSYVLCLMWINGLTNNVLWWLQLTFVSYFYTQISAPAVEHIAWKHHPSTVKSNTRATISFSVHAYPSTVMSNLLLLLRKNVKCVLIYNKIVLLAEILNEHSFSKLQERVSYLNIFLHGLLSFHAVPPAVFILNPKQCCNYFAFYSACQVTYS